MIYSYMNIPEQTPSRLKLFAGTTGATATPTGMVLGPDTFETFLEKTRLPEDINRLVAAITDEDSQKRVDAEIRRLILTARVPQEVGAEIEEIVEVLGLHKTELNVVDVPLMAISYIDGFEDRETAVLNIVGKKSLADAIRKIYASVYVSPHFEKPPEVAIVIFRMPPAVATVRVNKIDDQWIVQAVHGWGNVVEVAEEGDIVVVNEQATEIDHKDVQPQSKMLVRDKQTPDMMRVSDPDPNNQKITDQQALDAVRIARKTGMEGVVVGFAKEEKSWLLRLIKEGEKPSFVEQEEPEQPVEDIVEKPSESKQAPEEATAEAPHRWEEEKDIEEEVEQISQEISTGLDDSPRVSNAAKKEALRASELAVSHALSAITYALKEYLDVQDPLALPDLIAQVEQKKEVPGKQRLLSLWEMHQRGELKNPSPDHIQFVLETMNTFFETFSN